MRDGVEVDLENPDINVDDISDGKYLMYRLQYVNLRSKSAVIYAQYPGLLV